MSLDGTPKKESVLRGKLKQAMRLVANTQVFW
jgi:hypothetical protein